MRSFWLVLLAWTVPALLASLETVMFSRLGGQPMSLGAAFASQAPGWYTWALFTPLVARVARQFPLAWPPRAHSLAAHLGTFLLAATAAATAWALAGMLTRPGAYTFIVWLRNWFVSGLPFTIIVYAAIVGIVMSLAARARLRERERDAARLAQQLADAQLASLRMQLRPHFLFNSLNAVMALVRDGENGRAVSALSLLSDVLRTTLRDGAAHEVTLAEEVAFTRRYLDLEQLRFAERLAVRFDVAPELLDAMVPAFVLQPFVENAIKHGMLERRRGGTITIAARASEGTLHLTVRDDGPGLRPAWDAPGAGGTGIRNTRARLAQMYGERVTLRIGNEPAGGVAVEIALPLRRQQGERPPRLEQATEPALA